MIRGGSDEFLPFGTGCVHWQEHPLAAELKAGKKNQDKNGFGPIFRLNLLIFTHIQVEFTNILVKFTHLYFG